MIKNALLFFLLYLIALLAVTPTDSIFSRFTLLAYLCLLTWAVYLSLRDEPPWALRRLRGLHQSSASRWMGLIAAILAGLTASYQQETRIRVDWFDEDGALSRVVYLPNETLEIYPSQFDDDTLLDRRPLMAMRASVSIREAVHSLLLHSSHGDSRWYLNGELLATHSIDNPDRFLLLNVDLKPGAYRVECLIEGATPPPTLSVLVATESNPEFHPIPGPFYDAYVFPAGWRGFGWLPYALGVLAFLLWTPTLNAGLIGLVRAWRVSRWVLRPIIAVAAGCFALWMLTSPLREEVIPYEADEAAFGLMALRLLEGQAPPLFHYGQQYQGVIEVFPLALLMAAGFDPPLALKLLPVLWSAGSILLTVAAAWRWGSAGLGLFVLIAFALGGPHFYWILSKAWFGYPFTLLCGAVLMWIALSSLQGGRVGPGVAIAWGLIAGTALYALPIAAPFVAISGGMLVFAAMGASQRAHDTTRDLGEEKIPSSPWSDRYIQFGLFHVKQSIEYFSGLWKKALSGEWRALLNVTYFLDKSKHFDLRSLGPIAPIPIICGVFRSQACQVVMLAGLTLFLALWPYWAGPWFEAEASRFLVEGRSLPSPRVYGENPLTDRFIDECLPTMLGSRAPYNQQNDFSNSRFPALPSLLFLFGVLGYPWMARGASGHGVFASVTVRWGVFGLGVATILLVSIAPFGVWPWYAIPLYWVAPLAFFVVFQRLYRLIPAVGLAALALWGFALYSNLEGFSARLNNPSSLSYNGMIISPQFDETLDILRNHRIRYVICDQGFDISPDFAGRDWLGECLTFASNGEILAIDRLSRRIPDAAQEVMRSSRVAYLFHKDFYYNYPGLESLERYTPLTKAALRLLFSRDGVGYQRVEADDFVLYIPPDEQVRLSRYEWEIDSSHPVFLSAALDHNVSVRAYGRDTYWSSGYLPPEGGWLRASFLDIEKVERVVLFHGTKAKDHPYDNRVLIRGADGMQYDMGSLAYRGDMRASMITFEHPVDAMDVEIRSYPPEDNSWLTIFEMWVVPPRND